MDTTDHKPWTRYLRGRYNITISSKEIADKFAPELEAASELPVHQQIAAFKSIYKRMLAEPGVNPPDAAFVEWVNS